MRQIKFDVRIRRKDGSDCYNQILTLDDLLDRNGCLYSPSIQEVVYKREFTGLKDKNGKEIYEGDILNCNETSYSYKNDVKFVDHGFWLVDEKGGCHMPCEKSREIIGNIHEDKNLLR